MGMNKNILRLALPAIIANVTIPLLGLLDTAIAGHMGETAYIGAIAVGSMMFNLIYWNFGFLRMGTSGVTAQSYGADDMRGATLVLVQSCVLALAIAAAIVLLQTPLCELCMTIIDPSPVVAAYALDYYDICVWGAPPVLVMMSIKGWLLGMQDSASAMMVSIVVNVLNIVLSLMCVYGARHGAPDECERRHLRAQFVHDGGDAVFHGRGGTQWRPHLGGERADDATVHHLQLFS